MASLATAMTNSGVEYSDELTYMPGFLPRSANDPSLEKEGMQIMSKEDKSAYDQCKEMCRGGACPPLMVTFDSHEGDGRKKQNLRSVRFNVDGEAHALLIATRDINKGERLYYDYNGYQHDYPTEHFGHTYYILTWLSLICEQLFFKSRHKGHAKAWYCNCIRLKMYKKRVLKP